MQLIVIKVNLAEFVANVMREKSLSSYDVARNSDGEISQSTVNKIVNRDIRSHSIETLGSLAKGLGVPEETLFRVARGLPPEPPTLRYEIYAEAFSAEGLTDDEWRFLEGYFEGQVRQWQKLKSAANASIDKADSEQSPKKTGRRKKDKSDTGK